ncbi:MAG: DUF169 domain-containing protein [Thermoplasmata archaeon]|nr:DUF169 domain-containing protein [Thermoplasmata archaeon]
MSDTSTAGNRDWLNVAATLTEDLGLGSAPVQVSYLDKAPAGGLTNAAPAPSVCTFFAAGRQSAFVAPKAAHGSCEVGAYVFGMTPEGELGARLMSTVGWMESQEYLAPNEAAKIPHNPSAPEFVAYGPLGTLGVSPTVVLMFVRAKSLMLVVEAAARGWPDRPAPPMLSRPMCSLVPVLRGGVPVAVSVGCAGSRVYTQMGDEELVVGVAGDSLGTFAEAVRSVVRSNAEVSKFNRGRKESFGPEASPASGS